MKVLVKKAFYDIKKQVSRKVGEVFDATQARIDEIKGVDPDLIEVSEHQTKEKAVKAKPAAKKDEE